MTPITAIRALEVAIRRLDLYEANHRPEKPVSARAAKALQVIKLLASTSTQGEP